MKRLMVLVGLLFAAFGAQGAMAQGAYQPGDEIRGQSVQVETNGEVNTINFGQDGTAQISSQNGAQATGRWFTEGQTLCLELAGGARECWPYRQAFQAGQPVELTSTCSITSRWTALGTNQPALPVQERAGERG